MSAIENMRKMINLMETAVGRSRRRVNEGKMKELWMLIKQGKSAEEIAEILNVDVETIKSHLLINFSSIRLASFLGFFKCSSTCQSVIMLKLILIFFVNFAPVE